MNSESAIAQYRALLEVSESIALNRDLQDLFHDLARRLHSVVRFDYLNLVLYVPERHTMRLHVLETSEPTDMNAGSEIPVGESPSGWVWQTQQPLVIQDLAEETRYPKLVELLHVHGLHASCVLPLTTAQRRLGALGFGSRYPAAYSTGDLEFMSHVAAQVAVAVDNALHRQAAQQYQQQLARERDRLQVLLEVTNALVAHLDLRELFVTVSGSLRRFIRHDYTSLVLYEAENRQIRIHAVDFPGGSGRIQEEMATPVDGSPAGEAIRLRQPVLVGRLEMDRFPSDITRRLLEERICSILCVPLIRGGRLLGALNLGSRKEDGFTQEDCDFLIQIGNEVAIAVENALAYRQIAELRDKLAKEKLYLEDEIRTAHDFEEIVGESPAWKRVLRDVQTVAPTDSTVLIQGESGTGKELIARAIHNLSHRRERTFVKVNCAAIPTGLLESELFGHERGAFTGAISQKVGRFELADGGTLLLDEIGDIPLELQPKLLRVLQEHEFERLGGTRTIRVDVRLITSTNRDLAQMVAGREFRGDLYYRLNVFPISLPPLRERREDIPLMIRYFAQKYAVRMKKPIETIPVEAMDALTRWHWPGNVRELENLIERAVILSKGPVLQVPLSELRVAIDIDASAAATTLEEAEREHILRVLRETGGVVGGSRGAAARLGMKRTTLQSKMQKLGISRNSG